jgi:hypothetical protein
MPNATQKGLGIFSFRGGNHAIVVHFSGYGRLTKHFSYSPDSGCGYFGYAGSDFTPFDALFATRAQKNDVFLASGALQGLLHGLVHGCGQHDKKDNESATPDQLKRLPGSAKKITQRVRKGEHALMKFGGFP